MERNGEGREEKGKWMRRRKESKIISISIRIIIRWFQFFNKPNQRIKTMNPKTNRPISTLSSIFIIK